MVKKFCSFFLSQGNDIGIWALLPFQLYAYKDGDFLHFFLFQSNGEVMGQFYGDMEETGNHKIAIFLVQIKSVMVGKRASFMGLWRRLAIIK